MFDQLNLNQFGAKWCIREPQVGSPTVAALDRFRFSISMNRDTHDRLVALGKSLRPSLKKQYLVELAVERLLEDVEGGQLKLPLDRTGPHRGKA